MHSHLLMIINQKNHKCSMFHVPCFKKNGFSLIEILVAIGIVSVGIIAIVSLFNVNLKDEIRSKNKLTAIYLAQEAVEVVRQQRDTNWKTGVPNWDNGIPNNAAIIGLSNKNNITEGWKIYNIGGGNDWKKAVYYNSDESNDIFHYAQLNADDAAAPDTWDETNFKRWLMITNCGANCLTVTAHVSHPNFSPDIQVSARIYDWMP